MMKRNEHDDVEDDEETSTKKQRLDDMALVTLPGSLELSASGAVREKVSKNILQSSTVLLTGHTEAIYSIAFDPSGMHLASASMDRTISELLQITINLVCFV
jgi:WD40 repeat protein